MKYSYKEVVDSLPVKKNSRSSFWVRLWVRKFSFPITYLFINAGWSANAVSLLSWAIIFLGAVCLCIDSFWIRLLGVLLTNFWLVLDCVDGNIARCKKQKSFMGDFFDAIAGYGPFAFTTLALGIAAAQTSVIVPGNEKNAFIVVGAIGAVANIYARLIHQKYLACYFSAECELGEYAQINLKDEQNKKSFAYIREQIDKNIGVAGLFMPWLFVALFTNTFDLMTIFYAVYYVLSFLVVIVLYCKKGAAFEIEAQRKLAEYGSKK